MHGNAKRKTWGVRSKALRNWEVWIKMAVVTDANFCSHRCLYTNMVSEIGRECQPNWYQKLVTVFRYRLPVQVTRQCVISLIAQHGLVPMRRYLTHLTLTLYLHISSSQELLNVFTLTNFRLQQGSQRTGKCTATNAAHHPTVNMQQLWHYEKITLNLCTSHFKT